MTNLNNRKLKIKGLAAIELTLILPILLFLVFIVAEYSRLLYQYNALNSTVRDAARYLIDYGTPGSTNVIDITPELAKNASYLISSGEHQSSNTLLPNLGATASMPADSVTNNYVINETGYELRITVVDDFITLTVIYDWQPVFADLLPTFSSQGSFDLSYDLVVHYTMRAL
ncbi:TadE family protein [Thalassotalea crassostreae]|uniref:TadE family protein n=1 Tax=Thalassotalea crassostreae TaxID=1763536 RepID=UPI000837AE0C|nr:TadE/TadG family type IV pilus assembly protein [Thalassotalea crassostreae]